MHNGLLNNPSDFYIASNLTYNQTTRCREAMTTWNNECFTYDCLYYAGRTSVSTYQVEDNLNVITKQETDETYLAQTCFTQVKYTFLWINWYAKEIDININPAFDWYAFSSEDNITSATYDGYFDLETAMLHEFGHVLGLDHSSSEFSFTGQRILMFATIRPETIIRTPSDDDRNGIAELY